ncbi:MAG TPA: SprT-like domain-containing protein [Stellaceae bacterium]|nr:SprT-like domain-containing protein [Stellaceae bacterium]
MDAAVTLRLTPEMLATAYEFLRVSAPFRAWKFPDADEVEFHVIRARDRRGHYCQGEGAPHRIAVSAANVGHTETLIRTVAHEMIHLYQRERRSDTTNAEHNAEFLRLARLVCLHHGFDPRAF